MLIFSRKRFLFEIVASEWCNDMCHIHTVQLPLFVQLVFSKTLLYWPFKYYINCLFPYKRVLYTHVYIIYIIPRLLYGGRCSNTKMRLPYSVSVGLDEEKKLFPSVFVTQIPKMDTLRRAVYVNCNLTVEYTRSRNAVLHAYLYIIYII